MRRATVTHRREGGKWCIHSTEPSNKIEKEAQMTLFDLVKKGSIEYNMFISTRFSMGLQLELN